MPEKRNILAVLSEDHNLDIENLDDHNTVLTTIGDCMSRYAIINNNRLMIAVRYEYICKIRFNRLFTREQVTKFKIADFTKTEKEKIANGEDVGKITGDEFSVESDDLLYVKSVDDGGNVKLTKIEDGYIIIFNQYDEWEIFKDINSANKYYDVQI